ncbi:MAG: 50S ribosomal protein L22 [Bacteroidia bacterium]|nr:50S ribosomal protein L22 [Bacteroidia bacterium]HOZ91105.1 50S ribosomal protein L22 [Bacteroidia bacterium]
MGSRKRLAAEERKEALKNVNFAKLNNCPTSPRKMRLVADLVRGKSVNTALQILRFTNKDAAPRIEKVLLSALSNWQAKNTDQRLEDSDLFIKEIYVDSARMNKRLRPAPQGRGYRIRKRSNHVTLIIDSKVAKTENTNTENN